MKDNKTYSKFEKVRILGARALQISQGAPCMIKVPSSMTKSMDIANLEWEANVIPIEIKNKTNNTTESASDTKW